ncbi:fumarylacetoacetate hydrolase family protein [Actinomadura madurae]|uniref:fumarylacetoacetate hydrolase family protein n=1 Tax=Actinomadura madurae TaxID=1993 RepID=UPI0020D21518|nr:fumarylacetoacetate hydrolase family protein [Actinomadura madurae]
MDHVLGYTAFNDLSARRKQTETMQFTLGKNADRSGPIGPVLVTADELPDHRDLRLRTRVNGEVVQDASTGDMIHGLPEIIAYISDTVSLLPGDVIATGTPSGVGASMDPPRFLNDGDVVEVEVEHIGVLRTPIIDRRDLQVFH